MKASTARPPALATDEPAHVRVAAGAAQSQAVCGLAPPDGKFF